MSSNKNQRIEPEAFRPYGSDTAKDTASVNSDQEKEKGGNKRALTAPVLIFGLVLLALSVIFLPSLLPNASDNALGSNSSIDEELIETLASENTPAESPWVDSQLLKARREAQEILEELLSLQQRLESVQVEIWAQEQYQNILDLALSGDEFYQSREFETALQNYTDALDIALQIDSSIPEIAAQYYQLGIISLEQNNLDEATAQLELSDQLVSGDPDTRDALARARVRGQILSLSQQAEALKNSPQDLEQAQSNVEAAIDLDETYAPSERLLEDIKTLILERDFRHAMSRGFTALASSEYVLASQAFEEASVLKPSDQAVTGALQQVEAAKLNNARETALSSAERLEAEEQWSQALGIYQQLLTEDSSLSAARLGSIRSQARATLDADIEKILQSPLALQDDSLWRQANQTLSEARAIIDSGERLSRQTEQLEEILQKARTPVLVKLASDNQTDIEIYRVGKLGAFVEQAMHLNPGNYVIVGRRSGYQDVRLELEIDGSEAEVAYSVICTQAI